MSRFFKSDSASESNANTKPCAKVDLQYTTLEPRQVLDAEFQFDSGIGLLLSNFESANPDEGLLQVSGSDGQLIFMINDGVWNGEDDDGDDVTFAGIGTNILTVVNPSQEILDIEIRDNTNSTFDIEFGSFRFSNDFRITADMDTFRDVTQTSSVAVPNFEFTVETLSLQDFRNDFESLHGNASGFISIGEVNGISSLDLVSETESVSVLSTGNITISNLEALNGDVTIGATGPITDDPGTSVNVGGDLLMFSRGGVTLADDSQDMTFVGGQTEVRGDSVSLGEGGIFDSGSIQFKSSGLVTIQEASDTVLFGDNSAQQVTLDSAGSISDQPNTLIDIEADANLIATDSIVIADQLGNELDVGGNATFSGNSVSVGQAGFFNAQTLTVESIGDVDISEDSDAVFVGNNLANNLLVDSAGSVTDLMATSILVQSNLQITAVDNIKLAVQSENQLIVGEQTTLQAGDDIVVGLTGFFDTGTLTFNTAGFVSILESGDSDLTGTNSAGGLTFISTGAIADEQGTSIAITGNAKIAAALELELSDTAMDNLDISGMAGFSGISIAVGVGGVFNSGTVTFKSQGNVSINENSDTVLALNNSAATLMLNSNGSITDNPSTVVNVIGNAQLSSVDHIDIANTFSDRFNVGGRAEMTGSSITAGVSGIFNAGTLNVDSTGLVYIQENSDTQFEGTNTAGSLVVFSSQSITDGAGTNISVIGEALLNAGTLIELGDDSGDSLMVGGQTTIRGSSITLGQAGVFSSGTLTFNSQGDVVIREVGDTTLEDDSSAGSWLMLTEGTLSQLDSSQIEISGSSQLTATQDICLVAMPNDFGDAVALDAINADVSDRNDLLVSSAIIDEQLQLQAGRLGTGALILDGVLDVGLQVLLQASNGATQLSGGIATGDLLIGGDEASEGMGNFVLTQANAVSRLAFNIVGDLDFANGLPTVIAALTYESACSDAESEQIGQSAINGGKIALTADSIAINSQLTADTVSLSSSNGVTQSAAILATNLIAEGSGIFDLTFAGNDIDNLAALINVGNLNLVDVDGVTIATLVCGDDTFEGVNVTGNLAITTNGDIGQEANAPVVVSGETSLDAGDAGIICLVAGDLESDMDLDSDNDFNLVTIVNAGSAEIVDINALTVTSASATDQIQLQSGGLLTLAGNVTTGQLLLQSAAGAEQTAGFINANDLLVGGDTASEGSGDFNLLAENVVNRLGFEVAGALNLNAMTSVTIAGMMFDSCDAAESESVLESLASSKVSLTANGITLNESLVAETVLLQSDAGVVQDTSTAIIATNLILVGDGLFDLQGGNDIDNLAALIGQSTGSGTLNLVDVDQVTIGQLTCDMLTVTGLDVADKINLSAQGDIASSIQIDEVVTSETVFLTAGNGVSQTAEILTTNLLLSGFGTFDLTNGANDTVNLAASISGSLNYVDANAVTVTELTCEGQTISGLFVSGGLDLTTIGLLDQTSSGNIVVGGLTILNAGDADQICLVDAANDFDELMIANALNAEVADINEMTVVEANVVSKLQLQTGTSSTNEASLILDGNISTGDQVLLQSGDGVSQTGGMIITNELLLGGDDLAVEGAGVFDLAGPNEINMLAFNLDGTLNFNNTLTTVISSLTFMSDCTDETEDIIVSAAGNKLSFAGTSISIDTSINAETLSLSATNGVTQTSSITATNLILTGSGNFDLTNAGNDIVNLTATITDGNLDLVDATSVTIASIDCDGEIFNGVNIVGDLTITANGDLDQQDTAPVVVSGLTTLDVGDSGTICLVFADIDSDLDNDNDFNQLTIVAAASAELVDQNDLLVVFANVISATGNSQLQLQAGSDGIGTGALTLAGDIIVGNDSSNGTLLIQASNGAVQTGDMIVANDVLIGGDQVIERTGDFNFSAENNNVDRLAFNVDGNLNFNNNGPLEITDLSFTSCIASDSEQLGFSNAIEKLAIEADGVTVSTTVQADTILLNSSMGATQTAEIVANNLLLTGNGLFLLSDPNNDANNLAASIAGTLSFVDRNDVNITDLNCDDLFLAGVNVSDKVYISAGGASDGSISINSLLTSQSVFLSAFSSDSDLAVSQTAAVVADSLMLSGNGTFELTSNSNDVDALAANVVGALNFVDADDVTIAELTCMIAGNEVATIRGITIETDLSDPATRPGDLSITTAGDIGQMSDAPIVVQGLTTFDAGNTGAICLVFADFDSADDVDTDNDNDFNSLRIVNARVAEIVDRNDLTIEAANVVSGTADISQLQLQAGSVETGNLTILGDIVVGTQTSGQTLLQASDGVEQDLTSVISTNQLLLGGDQPFEGSGDFRLVGNNVVSFLAFDLEENLDFNSGGTITQIDALSYISICDDLQDESINQSIAGTKISLAGDGIKIDQVLTSETILLSSTAGLGQTAEIVATNLLIQGIGTFDLTLANNDVDNLAAIIEGDLIFTDADDINIASLECGSLQIHGLNISASPDPNSGNLTLLTGGNIAQDANAPVVVAGLTTLDTSGLGTICLVFGDLDTTNDPDSNNDNDFNELIIANSSSTEIVDRNSLTVLSANVTSSDLVNGGPLLLQLQAGSVNTGTLTLADSINVGNVDDIGVLLIQASGGAIQTGGLISGDVLLIGGDTANEGSGIFELTGDNQVDQLAFQLVGSLQFNNSDALEVATFPSYTSICDIDQNEQFESSTASDKVQLSADAISINSILSASTVFLNSTNGVSQTAEILATNLLLAGSGLFQLTNANNDTDNLAASIVDAGGVLNFVDSDDVTITELTCDGFTIAGLDVADKVILDARGIVVDQAINSISVVMASQVATSEVAVTQTQMATITATQLLLTGNGVFDLDNANNDVDDLAASIVGAMSYFDVDDVTIASLSCDGLPSGTVEILGVNIDGNLNLATIDGDLNQMADAPVIVSGLTVLDVGNATICLTFGDLVELSDSDLDNDNDFNELMIANAGSAEIVDRNDLSVLGAIVGSRLQLQAGSVESGKLELDGNILVGNQSNTGQLLLQASNGAEQQSGVIVANELIVGGVVNSSQVLDTLEGTGSFDLVGDNMVNRLAFAINGSLEFNNSLAIEIGSIQYVSVCDDTVQGEQLTLSQATDKARIWSADRIAIASVVDITVPGAPIGAMTLALQAANGISQTAEVLADNLLLSGTGEFLLNTANNDVDNIAASIVGSLDYFDMDDLTIASLTCDQSTINGLDISEDLSITTNNGDLSQAATASVVAGGLTMLDTGTGTICLLFGDRDGDGTNDNDLNRLTIVNAGSAEFVDRNALTSLAIYVDDQLQLQAGSVETAGLILGTTDDVGNIIVGNQVLLQSSDGINQVNSSITTNELIVGGNLETEGSGDFLFVGENVVDRLAFNVLGSLNFNNTQAIEIGAIDNVEFVSVCDPTENELFVDASASGKVAITAIGDELNNETGIVISSSVVAPSVLLNSSFGVSQQAAILAQDLLLVGNGTFALDTAPNDVDNVAALIGSEVAAGTLRFLDVDDITLATLTCNNLIINGVNVANDLAITTMDGDLNQASTAALFVGGLTTLDVGQGNVCLLFGDQDGDGVTDNDLNQLAIDSANVAEFVDRNDLTTLALNVDSQLQLQAGSVEPGKLTLGTQDIVGDITVGQQVLLQASNGIEQVSGIITTNELLLGGNESNEGTGDFNLVGANVVGLVAFNLQGTFDFKGNSSVQIGPLSYQSICDTTENEVLETSSATNKIRLQGDSIMIGTALQSTTILLDAQSQVTQNSELFVTNLILNGGGTFDLSLNQNNGIDFVQNEIVNLAVDIDGDLDLFNVGNLTLAELSCDALTVSGVNISGNLAVATDNGNINQDGNAPIIVSGMTTFDLGEGTICLVGADFTSDSDNNNDNNLNRLAVVSASNAEIVDRDDLALASANIASQLTTDNLLLQVQAGSIDTGALILDGDVNVGGTNNNGVLLLQASNGIQQTAGSIATTDLIVGGNAPVEGTGVFDLSLDNQIDRLAFSIVGTLNLNNIGSLEIVGLEFGSLCNDGENEVIPASQASQKLELTTDGLTISSVVSAETMLISSSAGADQNMAVVDSQLIATNLLLRGDGVFRLDHSANDTDNLAASLNGELIFVDADGVTLDALQCNGTIIQGVQILGNLSINTTNGNLTQTDAAPTIVDGNTTITAGNGFVELEFGDLTSDGFNDNDLNRLKIDSASEVEIVDRNSLILDSATVGDQIRLRTGDVDLTGQLVLDGDVMATNLVLFESANGVVQDAGQIQTENLMLSGDGQYDLFQNNLIGNETFPGGLSTNVNGSIQFQNEFAIELTNLSYATLNGSTVSNLSFVSSGDLTLFSNHGSGLAIFDSTEVNVLGATWFAARQAGGDLELDQLNVDGAIGVETADGDAMLVNQGSNGFVFRGDEQPNFPVTPDNLHFETNSINGNLVARSTNGSITNEANASLIVSQTADLIAGTVNANSMAMSNNEFDIVLGHQVNDFLDLDTVKLNARNVSVQLDANVLLSDSFVGTFDGTGFANGTSVLAVAGLVEQVSGSVILADQAGFMASDSVILTDTSINRISIAANGFRDVSAIDSLASDLRAQLPTEVSDNLAPRFAQIDSNYAIVVSNRGDLVIGGVTDALGILPRMLGIEADAGHVFVRTTGESGAGDVLLSDDDSVESMTANGQTFDIVSKVENDHVLTIVADGDLQIAANTMLVSSTGSVTDISEFSTPDGSTLTMVTREGPFMQLFLPTVDNNPTTRTIGSDDTQFIGLSIGRSGEQNFTIEGEFADDMIDLFEFSEVVGNRFVRISHVFAELFLFENRDLPATIRIFNDPSINLFDDSGSLNSSLVNLNTNENFLQSLSQSRPAGGLEAPRIDIPERIALEEASPIPDTVLVPETRNFEFEEELVIEFGELNKAEVYYIFENLERSRTELVLLDREDNQSAEDESYVLADDDDTDDSQGEVLVRVISQSETVTPDTIANWRLKISEGTQFPPGKYEIRWEDNGVPFSVEIIKEVETNDVGDSDFSMLDTTTIQSHATFSETNGLFDGRLVLADGRLSDALVSPNVDRLSLENEVHHKPHIQEFSCSSTELGIAAATMTLGMAKFANRSNASWASKSTSDCMDPVCFSKLARSKRKLAQGS